MISFLDSVAVIAAGGVLASAAFVLLLGWIAYRAMTHYRAHTIEFITTLCMKSGAVDDSFLSLPWIVETLSSPFGYRLGVRALAGERPRLVLFHHGIGWNWMSMARYIKLFLVRGWTVVAFDSRGCGGSGGGHPSFGVFEKEDMKAVADWALSRFSSTECFVAFGESMGAATALQYASLDQRLNAVIADCPYSSALDELRHRLARALVPPGVRGLVVHTADWLCKKKEGFSLAQADCRLSILKTSVPVMLIHGLEDDYVPWRMSATMAGQRRNALPEARTKLLLTPSAHHAESVKIDPLNYEYEIFSFIDECLARKSKVVHNMR
jgi:hypothetical protein